MRATINGKGQMVLPAKARQGARIGQGDVLDVEVEGDGRITLTRLEKSNRPACEKPKLVYRKGKPVVVGGPIVEMEVLKQLIAG